MSHGISKAWDPEHLEYLAELWAKGGHSGTSCARLINRKFGTSYTRNSVLSQVHRRLKKSNGQEPRRKGGRKPGAKAGIDFKPAAAPTLTITRPVENHREMPATEYEALSMDDPHFIGPPPVTHIVVVENLKKTHCRWPIGKPKTDSFRFCGKPRESFAGPYCAYHAHVSTFGYPKGKAPEGMDYDEAETKIIRMLIKNSRISTGMVALEIGVLVPRASSYLQRLRQMLESHGVKLKSEKSRGYWLTASDKVAAGKLIA